MKKKTFEILSDAISEVGSWQWWDLTKDLFQLEFCDVLLYDETKAEKDSHTSTIALRFYGNSFAVFLDNLKDNCEKKWYDRFHDDEIDIFPLIYDEFSFDDVDYAKKLLHGFKNITSLKHFNGENAFVSTKHILAAKCNDVGFVVGGDRLVVVGNKGEYTEEEIVLAAKRWWDYWRKYWIARETKDAYKKDYACEVTIPADRTKPRGRFYQE